MHDTDDLARLRQRRGDVIGGYVVDVLLGIGGMGVVSSALQQSLDRPVALKVPHPELASDPQVRRRFCAEAQAGFRLHHRNLVRVIDFGDHGGVPFLVMERVVGLRLGEMLRDHGPMSVAAAVELVLQLLAGLQDAHAHGIVHADVKCDNILVETLPDGSTVPRLIDFGLARFIDDPAGDSMVSGTPEYLAPELIRGALPTFASDVYAVGVMLYELICGDTPFSGGTSSDVMARQLADDPVPLSWRCPGREIPSGIEDVIARALAKQPEARYRDAAAFAAALEQLTQDAVPLPRTRSDSVPAVFATEAVTAPITVEEARSRAAGDPQSTPHAALAQHRRAVAAAFAVGDGDAIVVAYLELARSYVDSHDLTAAIAALEHGIEVLSGRTAAARNAPMWRLLLTLAALYSGSGNHTRARTTTRAAHDHATRIGSAVGRERARLLLARLDRDRHALPRAPW
jgi:hypothetical protein